MPPFYIRMEPRRVDVVGYEPICGCQVDCMNEREIYDYNVKTTLDREVERLHKWDERIRQQRITSYRCCCRTAGPVLLPTTMVHLALDLFSFLPTKIRIRAGAIEVCCSTSDPHPDQWYTRRHLGRVPCGRIVRGMSPVVVLYEVLTGTG
jgi:hypothetical protein